MGCHIKAVASARVETRLDNRTYYELACAACLAAGSKIQHQKERECVAERRHSTNTRNPN